MKTYNIPEKNFEKLLAKTNAIRKKIERYGGQFTFEIVGSHFETVEVDGIEMEVKFIEVQVEGHLEFKGWKYCASVENTDKGNVIITRGGEEIPEHYYHSAPVCDHCHSNRYRRYTYVIRNINTNEYKQVGKACLEEYTCGLNAEAVVAYLQMFEDIEKGTIDRSNEIYYVDRDLVMTGFVQWMERNRIDYRKYVRDAYMNHKKIDLDTYDGNRTYIVTMGKNPYKPCKNTWKPGRTTVGYDARRYFEYFKTLKANEFDVEKYKTLIEACKTWYSEAPDDRGIDFHNYKTLMELNYVPIEDFGILCNGFFEWSSNELHREDEEKAKAARDVVLAEQKRRDEERQANQRKADEEDYNNFKAFIGTPVTLPEGSYVTTPIVATMNYGDTLFGKDEKGVIYNLSKMYHKYVDITQPSVIRNAKIEKRTMKIHPRNHDWTIASIDVDIVTLGWVFNDRDRNRGTSWRNETIDERKVGNDIEEILPETKDNGFAGDLNDVVKVEVSGFKRVADSQYGTSLYEATDAEGKIYGIWSKTELTTKPCIVEGKITKLNNFRGRKSTIVKVDTITENKIV